MNLGIVTGSNNIALGVSAMDTLTSGISNIAIGGSTLDALTTGHCNIAIGTTALDVTVTGCFSIAIGTRAMGLCAVTGTDNVAIGQYAGYRLTTGYSNVALGYNTGSSTTSGCNNVAIGNAAGSSVSSQNNTVNIGPAANKTTSTQGCIPATMYGIAWNATSDCRYKCAIVDSDLGLDFINALKPRKFKLKNPRDVTDSDGNLITGGDPLGKYRQKETMYGLIAQEVATALAASGKNSPHWDFSGYDDSEIVMGKTAGTKEEEEADPDNVWCPGHHDYDPDHPSGIYQKTLGLTYTDFISPMIKASQELDDKIIALTARVTTLEG